MKVKKKKLVDEIQAEQRAFMDYEVQPHNIGIYKDQEVAAQKEAIEKKVEGEERKFSNEDDVDERFEILENSQDSQENQHKEA